MSQNQVYLYAIGMFLGGTIVTSLGFTIEYLKEKQFPKVKAIMRDFIIGAILVAFVLQLVPESMLTLLSYLPTTLPTPTLSMFGGNVVDLEPDLQVGPVRF